MCALKPRGFTWKRTCEKPVGFIADEFARGKPAGVVGRKGARKANGRTDPQMLDHTAAIPYLVAALQGSLAGRGRDFAQGERGARMSGIDLSTARMSADCRRSLTEPSEGRRLLAYRDCVGVTIGYGHTGRSGGPPVRMGDRLTEERADDILSDDLRRFEKGVAAALEKAKSPVLQREFDALVDLAFNIGLGAFWASSLLRAYVAGDKATACRKFADWNRLADASCSASPRGKREQLLVRGRFAGQAHHAGRPARRGMDHRAGHAAPRR